MICSPLKNGVALAWRRCAMQPRAVAAAAAASSSRALLLPRAPRTSLSHSVARSVPPTSSSCANDKIAATSSAKSASATAASKHNERVYEPVVLESRWQGYWIARAAEDRQSYIQRHRRLLGTDAAAKYILPMFPYPSGNLHVGHARCYTITDCLARYNRMRGFRVLHPIGWDAFGLPAENAARERGIEPAAWTKQNVAQMRTQLQRLGLAFNWEREVNTTDESYYRWTQELFLQLLEHGLAYQADGAVNWDPVDKTVLANEQVDAQGRSWRSGAKVERRMMRQWYFRTTAYAERLLSGLDTLDKWPSRVKQLQRAWIGKSLGAKVQFRLDSHSGARSDAAAADADGSSSGTARSAAAGPGAGATSRALSNTLEERDSAAYGSGAAAATAAVAHTADDSGALGFDDTVLNEFTERHNNAVKIGEVGKRAKSTPSVKAPARVKQAPVLTTFTTRADTLFGVSFVAISPDHPWLRLDASGSSDSNEPEHGLKELAEADAQTLLNARLSWVPQGRRRDVYEYIRDWQQRTTTASYKTSGDSSNDRSALLSNSNGIFLGRYVIHPLNGERVPLFMADYVLSDVGTSAVMGVPAHDERDAAFARTHSLAFKTVVVAADEEAKASASTLSELASAEASNATNTSVDREKASKSSASAARAGAPPTALSADDIRARSLDLISGSSAAAAAEAERRRAASAAQRRQQAPYTTDGVLVNSTKAFNGFTSRTGAQLIMKALASAGAGGESVHFKLRDWLVSRQRSWGTPIPIVYCKGACNGAAVPLPREALPVRPLIGEHADTRATCPRCGGEAERETDTMDTFVDSAWYWARYPDAMNSTALCSAHKAREWLPVDTYVGGVEHAVLHLLYARFICKFMQDSQMIATTSTELMNELLLKNEAKRRQLEAERGDSAAAAAVAAASKRKQKKAEWKNIMEIDEISADNGASSDNDVDASGGASSSSRTRLQVGDDFLHASSEKSLSSDIEPFVELINQGMVLGKTYKRVDNGAYVRNDSVVMKEAADGGAAVPHERSSGAELSVHYEKMSKSKHNGVAPEDVIRVYGADTTRLFVLFKAPVEADLEWDEGGVRGQRRWLQRIWKLAHRVLDVIATLEREYSNDDSNTTTTTTTTVSSSASLKRSSQVRDKSDHAAIGKLLPALLEFMPLLENCAEATQFVANELDERKFNTAIAKLMSHTSYLVSFVSDEFGDDNDGAAPVRSREPAVAQVELWFVVGALRNLLLQLAPFAPHITAELWSQVSRLAGGDAAQRVNTLVSRDKNLAEALNSCSAWSLHAVKDRTDIHVQPWPSHNSITQLASYIKERNNKQATARGANADQVATMAKAQTTILVQLNGKMKASLKTAPPSLSAKDAALVRLAAQDAKVRYALSQLTADNSDTDEALAAVVKKCILIHKRDQSGYILNLKTK